MKMELTKVPSSNEQQYQNASVEDTDNKNHKEHEDKNPEGYKYQNNQKTEKDADNLQENHNEDSESYEDKGT